MERNRGITSQWIELALAVTAVIALLCAPAFAQEETVADEPAIPPGQEQLLLEMLGLGASLPACDLVDGQVQYTKIKATYGCDQSEIEYELTHPGDAGRDAIRTDQFAITRKSGTPPEGFENALVSLIRSREAEFEWYWPTIGDTQ